MYLKEEIRSCQYFQVDFEVESVRYKVFIYSVDKSHGNIKEREIDHSFNKIKCAVILNLAFLFSPENSQHGKFR